MPHSTTNLLVHFIFSTKQRCALIKPEFEKAIRCRNSRPLSDFQSDVVDVWHNSLEVRGPSKSDWINTFSNGDNFCPCNRSLEGVALEDSVDGQLAEGAAIFGSVTV
jgi:hypothetical protein